MLCMRELRSPPVARCLPALFGAALFWCGACGGCSGRSGEGRNPASFQEDTAIHDSVETESNVVLLTIDGVRWQEFYGGADPARGSGAAFPWFWASLAPEGRVFDARVANPIHLSLPGYQSIFAGSAQPCGDNACGQIRATTFPERLVNELGLPRHEVASFASWTGLVYAIESHPGATFVDAGQRCGGGGEGCALGAAELSARLDAATMAYALRYLERQRPAFLYIALNDADEEGHRGQYDRYLDALRRADRWIEEIVGTLERMGAWGRRTALLITTDHGRGEGARWGEHGAMSVGDADARIWIYLRLPAGGRFAFGAPAERLTHLDIRPTVETLLGLAPRTGAGLGKSMVVRAEGSEEQGRY